nr:TetR/AcrR family transcriptional regulator [Streptomyces chartreusis]
MTRMPLEERRRQLIEAAMKAMARDGVAKTTTRAIATEAGTSLSVLHYCFESKQELVESVLTTVTAHSVTRLKESLESGPTLHESVRAELQARRDYICTHPHEHMFTYELTQYALREPGLEHLARRHYNLCHQAYVDAIEQLTQNTNIRLKVSKYGLARYIAAVAEGLTAIHYVVEDEVAWFDILDTITAHVASLVYDFSPDDL